MFVSLVYICVSVYMCIFACACAYLYVWVGTRTHLHGHMPTEAQDWCWESFSVTF